MPRIRQYADRDAMADFMGELNAQRARFGYDTQRSLAPVIGVCQATAGNYIRNPETIPFGVLRAIVKAVKPVYFRIWIRNGISCGPRLRPIGGSGSPCICRRSWKRWRDLCRRRTGHGIRGRA